MTIAELGTILNDVYNNAQMEDAALMIRLFGIKYAAEIKKEDYSSEEIIKASGISEIYLNELSKGVKLSEYVHSKQL
ncbi:HTH-like domain-containing protein [Flavobacterium sp. WC2509]|uniref:HTH-like domain-containing protein n=1 Tax=Flavobacterium sp. WC2509 TaxID=3461406 RepID=UPI00404511E6